MRVLITAGPTRESMDPVRYLTNASTGAMGFALAEAFQRRRAHVTVICGPTALVPPKKIKVIPVVTARDMDRAVKKLLPHCDALIATAAVCDFRFEKTVHKKIKKGRQAQMSARFVRNPDVLMNAGKWKKTSGRDHPLLVGYALETGRIEQAMKTKMKEKNLDLIIGNTPDSFAGETITPLWLERGGKIRRYPRMSKKNLGEKIFMWAAGHYEQ
jgi:phosphopantothenoylcysteine decarboxylase/phosphopantothenate--cysteine ligase